MALVYACKVFSDVINDSVNTYYSDPALEELLATAEMFCVQVNTSHVSGLNPKIDIWMSTAMDVANWTNSPNTAIKGLSIADGTFAFGYDWPLSTNQSIIMGKRVRFGAKLTGSGARAYVEIWIAGRDKY